MSVANQPKVVREIATQLLHFINEKFYGTLGAALKDSNDHNVTSILGLVSLIYNVKTLKFLGKNDTQALDAHINLFLEKCKTLDDDNLLKETALKENLLTELPPVKLDGLTLAEENAVLEKLGKLTAGLKRMIEFKHAITDFDKRTFDNFYNVYHYYYGISPINYNLDDLIKTNADIGLKLVKLGDELVAAINAKFNGTLGTALKTPSEHNILNLYGLVTLINDVKKISVLTDREHQSLSRHLKVFVDKYKELPSSHALRNAISKDNDLSFEKEWIIRAIAHPLLEAIASKFEGTLGAALKDPNEHNAANISGLYSILTELENNVPYLDESDLQIIEKHKKSFEEKCKGLPADHPLNGNCEKQVTKKEKREPLISEDKVDNAQQVK